MAIYLATGYTTSSKKEQALASASASGGNYYSGNNTNVITCSTAWNLAGFDTLTLTWQNDMRVGYWTNPAGSYTNSTRYSYLVFADGTELLLGTGTAQTTQTVDLAKYTDTQKVSVTLRGKLDYYLSTTTNATTYGGITATDVIAVGSTSGGTTYEEIGKLYEVGGSGRSQISKVYDWNGSAMSLIYTSETTIFTKVNVQTSVASGAYVTKTAYSPATEVSLDGCKTVHVTGTTASVVTGTGEWGSYGGKVFLSVQMNGVWNDEYALLVTTSTSNIAGTYPETVDASVDISSVASSITAIRLYVWTRTQNANTACSLYAKAENMTAVAS